MAIADTKKCQTLINVCAEQMVTIRAAVSTMEMMRDVFIIADPDTTDTPLDGNLATLNTALSSLKTEANKTVWTMLIAAYAPSHRNKALD